MIFSLQKRFLVLLLLPVLLVLSILGLASFLYARSFLLDQWNLTTKLSLEKTAHQIRMRLDEKREMMGLIALAEKTGDPTQSFLIQELRKQRGVLAANLETAAAGQVPIKSKESNTVAAQENITSHSHSESPAESGGRSEELHGPHDVLPSGMKPIQMDVNSEKSYLTLATVFPSGDKTSFKKLSVTVRLDYLVQHLLHMSLWQGGFACLVAADGTYLAHTDRSQNWPKKLGQSGHALEKEVLQEIKRQNFGTVFGQGSQADTIMGYYRIPTTLWHLLLTSKKDSVLAPLLRFRYSYLSAVLVSVLFIGLPIPD
jgi:hypothetical protein